MIFFNVSLKELKQVKLTANLESRAADRIKGMWKWPQDRSFEETEDWNVKHDDSDSLYEHNN